MFQHCRQFCFIFVLILLGALSVSGCDQLNSVNGSFEESMESGRLKYPVQGGETVRFFRFHLRQFDDAVGGTFETFDLSGYEKFTTVPEFMNNAVSFYYCARIDYGYVRNNQANIVFTDREQRQWLFQARLGEENLSGSIRRMNFNNLSGEVTAELDSLMPEDAAFLESGGSPDGQMVLQTMRKDSDKSLECIYYFKTSTLKFHFSDAIPLERCHPSASRCRSLKLAIVGMFPHHQLKSFEPTLFQDVTTVYLDNYDVGADRIRTVHLRDNPFVTQYASPDSIFIATAVVYEDLDQNGVWNKSSEPVWAALDHQILVFYGSTPETAIYGRSSDGVLYEEPIIRAEEMPAEPGWHVFSYDPDNPETASHAAIRKMTPDNATVLSLRPIHMDTSLPEDMLGCYLKPDSGDKTQCIGILPVLFE